MLTNISLSGQSSDKVVVYGKVTSAVKDFKPFSYSGISYKQYTSDGGWFFSSISVDKNGQFKQFFPKNTKLELHTYYDDFYESDTTVNTGSGVKLQINFTVYPKIYLYTQEQAEKDISTGKVMQITFDSLIYKWNQKINFTKDFGFNYIFLPEPYDYDFKNNIYKYNSRVQEYLTTINDSNWAKRLFNIEDSLIHIEADNYGKSNKINLEELTFNNKIKLPSKMVNTTQKQKSEFERLFSKNRNEIMNFTSEFMLGKIDNDSNYYYVFVAEYWLTFNYEEMIPELIKRITNKKEVGLINTADLIISERIQSGDLQFYGHGGVAFDDLFTVAGRANHLLKRITGEDFGSVSMYSTEQDLKKIQNRWVYWIINLKND
jgi:hypothetical protein